MSNWWMRQYLKQKRKEEEELEKQCEKLKGLNLEELDKEFKRVLDEDKSEDDFKRERVLIMGLGSNRKLKIFGWMDKRVKKGEEK